MPEVRTFNRILDGEHVIGELDRLMSRDQIMLGASATYTLPGTVLGQVTATKQYVPVNKAANDGSQTAAAILWAGRKPSTAGIRAVAHTRTSRHNGKKLTYPAGSSQADMAAFNQQLAAAGIQVGY